MPIQRSHDFFFYELCSLYDVEQKLVQMLTTLANESQNVQVKEAFLQHQQETQQHIHKLEQCFQSMNQPPAPLESRAMFGLKQDHDIFLQQRPAPAIITMFNVGTGLKSEYLEIVAYKALIQLANSLGYRECVPLLQQNLAQEEATAQKLSALVALLDQHQIA